MWRRHVRQGSAASSGLGSGLGGTRGQHTRENLFHWPGGQNKESTGVPHGAALTTQQNQHGVKNKKKKNPVCAEMHNAQKWNASAY